MSWEQWLAILFDAPGLATLVLIIIVYSKVHHIERMLELREIEEQHRSLNEKGGLDGGNCAHNRLRAAPRNRSGLRRSHRERNPMTTPDPTPQPQPEPAPPVPEPDQPDEGDNDVDVNVTVDNGDEPEEDDDQDEVEGEPV